MSTEVIVPNDPRSDWERLSRSDIRKCMEALNIELKPSQSLNDAINLMRSMGTNPKELLEWEPIPVKLMNGSESVEYHPKRIQPVYTQEYIQKRDHELEMRLEAAEERAKAEAAKQKDKSDNLEKDNEKLHEQVRELTKLVLGLNDQLHKLEAKELKKTREKETDPRKMKYMAFKKWCKDKGHELQKGEIREEVIARLENEQSS